VNLAATQAQPLVTQVFEFLDLPNPNVIQDRPGLLAQMPLGIE